MSVMVMCYLSDECVGFGMFRGGSLGASLEVGVHFWIFFYIGRHGVCELVGFDVGLMGGVVRLPAGEVEACSVFP